MLTMWYLAILHHLGWAVGPSALPAVTAREKLILSDHRLGHVCRCLLGFLRIRRLSVKKWPADQRLGSTAPLKNMPKFAAPLNAGGFACQRVLPQPLKLALPTFFISFGAPVSIDFYGSPVSSTCGREHLK